jgi:hypothetical protein
VEGIRLQVTQRGEQPGTIAERGAAHGPPGLWGQPHLPAHGATRRG